MNAVAASGAIAVEQAPAKLNLALHVRGRLADGRHRIETIFAFCEDGDRLTAEPAEHLALTATGPFADQLPDSQDNLALRAARLLAGEAGITAAASLSLDKQLPVASGIGGGSADAAAALRALTRLWRLDPAIAARVAPRLGSDVPACLASRTSRGDGAGDVLAPVDDPSLAGMPVLLANPRRELSTAAVFGRWDGIDRGPLGDWRQGRNDLEPAAIALVPEIAELLAWLRHRPGVAVARMAGSGASCFALFADVASRDRAALDLPAGWWRLATRLR